MPPGAARRLIDLRDSTVTVVFSAVRRVSGWTRPADSLSQRICRELATTGNSVLIGISDDVEATSQIPDAHRRAALALRLAHVGDRVLHFDRVSLRQLMLHRNR